MKLLGDFFQIIENQDNKFSCVFNKEHFIYKAHFPNNPITPGVCILQISKELLEHKFNQKLFFTKIKNIKFISLINPNIEQKIDFLFTKLEKNENIYTFSIDVKNEEKLFSKISGEMKIIRENL